MLIFRIWWSLQFYTIFVPFWRIKENIGTKYRADSPLEFLQVCWEILLWEYPLFENKRVFEMLITSNSIERSVVKTIDFVWRSNQKYLNLFGPLVYRLIGLLLFKLYCLVIWLTHHLSSFGWFRIFWIWHQLGEYRELENLFNFVIIGMDTANKDKTVLIWSN